MQSTSYIYTIVDLFWENGCKGGQPKITWGNVTRDRKRSTWDEQLGKGKDNSQ